MEIPSSSTRNAQAHDTRKEGGGPYVKKEKKIGRLGPGVRRIYVIFFSHRAQAHAGRSEHAPSLSRDTQHVPYAWCARAVVLGSLHS